MGEFVNHITHQIEGYYYNFVEITPKAIFAVLVILIFFLIASKLHDLLYRIQFKSICSIGLKPVYL